MSVSRRRARAVLDTIRQYVPDVRILSVVGLEAIFVLPQTYRDRFETLFAALQHRQRRLRIAAFGLSVTTMEEVFLV